MKSATKLTFPVVSFRKLDTPFNRTGFLDFYAVVDTRYLPDLTGWRKINVRDPKLKGSVPEAIRQGFRSETEMFLFMNRGIVLSVDSVEYDNKSSVVTITFRDPLLHGLLDGGHTYNIVQEETAESTVPQFIKIEFLEGFSTENITLIVDARNTSNQVRDESLMNLGGKFDPLREALSSTSFFDQIAFKEFELDANGDPKPIDVREIIAILTVFDKTNFSAKTHPINAYRSKAACLQHFDKNADAYRPIYPLAAEICELYDQIQLRLPSLYNKARGQQGEVKGGRFGKLTGVTYYEKKTRAELRFIRKRFNYGVPAGFIYPILGAFRSILETKAGRYVWGSKLDPVQLLEGDLGLSLADTIGNFALDAQNPSKTGKSPIVWQACYQTAEVYYLRNKSMT